MALEEKITVDASGALSGVQALNATIASIGESLGRLNTDLGKTKQAFDSLETKLTSTLRSARDAALSLSRAANEATSSVQKAVSGLATIDTALEKRVARVKELRAELQNLSGTALAGGPQGPGSRGGLGGTGGGGGGDGLGQGLARLGDFNRFGDQLTRQFSIIAQSRAFFFLKDQIAEAANEAKELTARITEIQTITQDADKTTEQWAGTLLKVSSELGRPVTQVADAAYQALSNNVRGAKGNTEEFLLSIGRFANVTRTTLPGAVDAISSVLNSYGLSANQATEVSGKLFKAIELGRFRGEELSNALGKTAPIASQLGISLDELLGTFVTLTDQGQSLNTASTLTLNLFNSLLKPSTELTNLYQNQGVASGQAFIQVNNGIAGVLELLGNKSKGATEEITKFFTNIRATRGVIGLTEDLRRFQNSFADIKGSERAFQVAVEIDQNSTNRAVDKFRQSLKNASIDGLGGALLGLEGGLARIEQSTGLIAGGIKLLPAAGFALLVQQITRFAAQSVIGRNALVAMAFTAPNLAESIALVATNAALFVGAFTAAFAIGQKLFAQSESQARLIDDSNKKIRERSNLLLQQNSNNQNNGFKSIEDSFTRIQQKAAASRAQITGQFDAAKESVRRSFEVVTASLTSAVERSRQTIQDINRDISRNLNEIDNSRKSLGDFRATAEKSFIGLKLDLANPQQQIQILANEIDRLTAKGKNLLISGAKTPGTQGEEQIREGRADLAEALNLANQRVKAIQTAARESGNQLTSTQVLNALENEQLRIINAKRFAENELQRIKGQEIANLKAQKADEQERLTRLEESIKKFGELQTKIGQGTINKDKDFFRNGSFSPAAVESEIARLANTIQEGLFKIDPGAAARFTIDLATTVKASQDAIGLTIKDANARRDQEQLIQDREAAKKRFNAIKQINEELQSSLINTDKGGIASSVQKIQDVIKETINATPITETLTNPGSGISNTRRDFVKQLIDVKELLLEIQKIQAGPDGIINIPPELLARLQAVKTGVDRLNEPARGLTGNGVVQDNVQIISDQIQRTINLGLDLNNAVVANNGATNALNELELSTKSQFNASLTNLNTVTEKATQQIGGALDRLEGRINAAFQNIPGAGAGAGGDVPGFSHGGLVPAGKGMDTILAALRPGETVMNPTATRMFASQIQAMNSFASIPYGSSQNVTVGDVNVFVSDANSSSQTIREIGRGIRREVRRGNLKF